MEFSSWFPDDKKKLNELLDNFIVKKKKKGIHGLIVPHAGFLCSGKIAGRAFGLLDDKIERAIVFGPSHYRTFSGVCSISKIKTPLGKVDIIKNEFEKIEYDHSVVNEIPFLQKLNPNIKILPLVVGEISFDDAKFIAKKMENFSGVFIFSTDLSHFFKYEDAVLRDKKSIKKIESLDVLGVDACGIYPLMIMQELCKLRGWKPKLIEYKNSGDVMQDRSAVVGYASFEF